MFHFFYFFYFAPSPNTGFLKSKFRFKISSLRNENVDENDFNEEDDADEATIIGRQPPQQTEGKKMRKLQTQIRFSNV